MTIQTFFNGKNNTLRSTVERYALPKDYAKLYFDSKYLEKGFNRGEGWRFLNSFSRKVFFFLRKRKVLLLANIEHCPKFLEYALTGTTTTAKNKVFIGL